MEGLLDLLTSGEDITFQRFKRELIGTESHAEAVAEYMFERGYTIDTEHPDVRLLTGTAELEAIVSREKTKNRLLNVLGMLTEVEVREEKAQGYDAIKSYRTSEFLVEDVQVSVPIRRKEEVNGDVHDWYETDYRIWQCKWDESGKVFYVLARPDTNFDMGRGSRQMAMKRIGPDDLDGYRRPPHLSDSQIESMFDLDTSEKDDMSGWGALKAHLASGNVEMRKPITAIPEDDKEEVSESIDIQNAIDMHLRNNHSLDPVVKYVFRSQLVDFNDGRLDHTNVMPYNPHGIMITNTGVGKSTTAEECGLVVERASDAGLLGFSSADEVLKGELNNRTHMVAFDEIEKSDSKFLEKLSSFLSNGQVRTFKGKAGVVTRGSPNVLAFANPYTQEDEGDEGGLNEYDTTISEQRLLESFDEVLHKISEASGFSALGRRLAIVVFGNNFDTAAKHTDRNRSQAILDKNTVIVDSMLNHTRNKVSDIFSCEPVQAWLNSDLAEYEEQVLKNLRNKDGLMNAVRDFWKGNAIANKRIRGFALKQGILDNIEDIWLDDDFSPYRHADSVLEDAKDHLSRAMELNLKSLQNMGKVEVTENDIVMHRWRSLDDYKSNIVLAAAAVAQDRDVSQVMDTELSYRDMQEVFDALDDSTKVGGYNEWDDVRSAMPDTVGRLSSELESVGLKVLDKGGSNCYKIVSRDVLTVGEVALNGSRDVSQSSQGNEVSRDTVLDHLDRHGPCSSVDLEDEYGDGAQDVLQTVLQTLVDDGLVYEAGKDRYDVL